MMQTMFEKLQLTEEKNLLIQGLPSSIEKQFSKISFAKSVTPLLRSRRIDFALVFAINQRQLEGILKEVLPALGDEGKLWVAYPKPTSKIVSDLNRDCNWKTLSQCGYESEDQVTLDHVWTALRFKRPECCEKQGVTRFVKKEASIEGVDNTSRTVVPPADLQVLFNKNKKASLFFDKLSFTNKKEYLKWLAVPGNRNERLTIAVERLAVGKRSPLD
ncbi:MAG: YdeI/OmpD-associated family protein [Chitinophagaceae bacterium]|nr:YdeI/OmpD-associated family protein [Chitinophagaceae bacterium]MCW5927539.1 YdeI/OmpD-associated family protein [Chitinophagaceae bacterium]